MRTRPDILLPVDFLTTRVNKFTEQDKVKLERILRYLNSTVHLGLVLKCDDVNDIQLTTHADASYGTHKDGKGQTGMVTSMGIGNFHSSSHKQKIVAKSSSEAELIAASDAASHSLGVRNYLISRGYNAKPIIIVQDNTSTKFILENGLRSARRMKHLNIRYFFVQNYIASNEIVIKYINTSQMVADILTKPLQSEKFKVM